jgi:hypothetical protein
LNYIITQGLVRVLLVVWIPVVLYLRWLLVDDVLRALKEIRDGIFLVLDADIHISLVLNELLLEEIIHTIFVLLLLFEYSLLNGSQMRLLCTALRCPLIPRLRLLRITNNTWRAWPKVTTNWMLDLIFNMVFIFPAMVYSSLLITNPLGSGDL